MHTEGVTHALEVTDVILSDSTNYFLKIDDQRYLVAQLIVEGTVLGVSYFHYMLPFDTCNIKNSLKYFAIARLTLIIIHCFAVPETPVSFATHEPSTMRVPQGSLAKIECNISSTNEIAWYRDDDVEPLESSDRYKMHTDGANRALEITETVLSDSANYFVQVDGHRILVSQLIVEGTINFLLALTTQSFINMKCSEKCLVSQILPGKSITSSMYNNTKVLSIITVLFS